MKNNCLCHRIGGTEESVMGKKPHKEESSPVRDVRFITGIKKQKEIV